MTDHSTTPTASLPSKPSRWLTALRVVGVVLAIAAFATGVALRWQWVYRWNDPRSAQYSDMKFYITVGERISKPGYVLNSKDITHPPGMSLTVAASYRMHEWLDRDLLDEVDRFKHPLRWVVGLNFLVSLCVPLCAALWAWAAFGRATALGVLAATSLYYPFISYAGFILAEIYVMALIPLAVGLFLWGTRARREWVMTALCLTAGVVMSVGTGYKLVVLPGLACMGATYLLFTRQQPWRRRMLVLVLVLIGAAPGLTWLSARSTRANNGQWCLVSNKNAADFLLGHYGRIRCILWHDAKGRGEFQFGSPAAVNRGYQDAKSVPFSMTDSKANYDEAWKWIRNNLGEATVLSFQHVHDLFVGAAPWPTGGGVAGLWAEGFQYVFLFMLLIPSVALIGAVMATMGWRGFLGSTEFMTISPILGVMFSAFMATGELRYRLPWDAIFIILAVQAARLALTRRVPA